jgi:hypothetical protein
MAGKLELPFFHFAADTLPDCVAASSHIKNEHVTPFKRLEKRGHNSKARLNSAHVQDFWRAPALDDRCFSAG